jgi:hypothetical protein
MLHHFTGVYELHFDATAAPPTLVTLYRRLDHGQLELVATYEQGPFDTDIDALKWIWGKLEVDTKRQRAHTR